MQLLIYLSKVTSLSIACTTIFPSAQRDTGILDSPPLLMFHILSENPLASAFKVNVGADHLSSQLLI